MGALEKSPPLKWSAGLGGVGLEPSVDSATSDVLDGPPRGAPGAGGSGSGWAAGVGGWTAGVEGGAGGGDTGACAIPAGLDPIFIPRHRDAVDPGRPRGDRGLT
jgi:hypothetical protein